MESVWRRHRELDRLEAFLDQDVDHGVELDGVPAAQHGNDASGGDGLREAGSDEFVGALVVIHQSGPF